jgi:GTP-binding protein
VGTKADLLPAWPDPPPSGIDVVVSGATGRGVDVLSARLAEAVARAKAEEPARSSYVVVRPAREPFQVRRDGERFRVSGPRVERWVAEVDLEDPRQVVDLQRRLVRAGVERRLAEAGAVRGDEVVIGQVAFEFIPEDERGEPTEGPSTDGKADTLRDEHEA